MHPDACFQDISLEHYIEIFYFSIKCIILKIKFTAFSEEKYSAIQ